MAHAWSTTVDSAVEELGWLKQINQSGSPELVLRQEFKFLMRFTIWLFTCKEVDLADSNLSFAYYSLEDMLKSACVIRSVLGEVQALSDLNFLVTKLLIVYDKFESEVRNVCSAFLGSLKSMSCSPLEIMTFIDVLVENLRVLANLKTGINASVKNQMMVHQKKLIFFRTLVKFSRKRCVDCQILEDLLDYVKNEWIHRAACLSLLCLWKGKDASMFTDLLFHQEKFTPCTLEIARMLFDLLKALKPSRSDTIQVSEAVVGVVDFVLNGFPADPSKDFVEILKDNLIFMTSFIMDLTPKEETVTSAAGVEVLLRLRAKVVVDELLSLIFSLQKDRSTVEDISSLQLKIDKVKAKIRELFYVPFLNPLDFTFPMTNVLGSVNFFLENLKAMVSRMAFGKNQVMIIQAKLISFKSFLEDIMDKAKEIDDQTNLWRRIVKLVFIAEHVISSCLVKNHPIWYDMLRLSDVILAFNLIEIKVKRYSEHQKHKNRLMTSSVTKCSHVSRRQVIPSSLEDVMVDLKDESMKITEKLNLRTKQLQIVSIVGMAGLGKTTIAKKVYHDPSTTYNFERRAWCCVSQSYNLREMFLDILTDVTGVDARQSDYESTDDDLALKLRRSLRQLRYLIVLDDIWNMEAWECLKPSFPDDKKGSRIIFTSRIQNLVWQAELINCSVHSLRSLSDRESWELFHRKLCHYHGSPLDEEQSKLGKSIVKNCKGLPLSVVLVAGILAGQDIESWKQIECSTSSKFVSEGCMDVLELSYNHLPNHLKPCLLYVGGFPEDTVIKAQKLMSLWIAEGLVPRSDNKSISLYKVAEDYLSDLSSRSLVIPEKRSFNGSIKVCRVHDLIHDLCLVKSRKDNFLQPVQDNDIISVSHSALNPLNYESYYRLCISAEWTKFINAKPAGPLARSLVALRGDEKWKIVSCASDIFHTFRLLNVLDLECVKIDGPFPKEVTLMVNLRYLAIYCVASELPSSIANLWNLEILILLKGSSDGLFSLPRTFVGMKSLRYISIPWVLLSDGLEDHEHSQLEHLEMFSMLYAKTANQLKFFLRRLPRLRKLKCDLFFFFEDDQFLGLSRLTQLESLDVKGPGSLSDSKKWDHFPVLDFPGSLRKLSLQRFLLPWSAMSTIGQLPNLEVLKLNNEAFSGGRWDVEDGAFLKLKYLQLNTLDFEEWTVQDDPFPCLEQLIVKRCPRLHGIPPDLGNITTLKKIKMYRSAQASSSVREIFEEQRELGNDFLEVVIDGDHLKRP